MKVSRFFLAAALMLGALGTANARTITLGNLSDDYGTTQIFGNSINQTNHSFTDRVRFRFTEDSNIEGFFSQFRIPDLSIQLQHRESGMWNDLGSSFTQDFSFTDLAAGRYRFVITGSTGAKPGSWSMNLTAAPVPEADVVLMLLIGAGLIGLQLRRKHQSLGRQPVLAT